MLTPSTSKPSSPSHTHWVHWLILLLLSIVFITLFNLIQLPAAIMLGPMLAGIILGCRRTGIQVKLPFFKGAQLVIGCMIAMSISPQVVRVFLHDWWLFVIIVLSSIAVSSFLGYILARLRIVPLMTAVLGFTPGAASTMVILADEYHEDVRMVAFMQYLRVLMTAFTAAIIAAIVIPEQAPGTSASFSTWIQTTFPPLNATAFGSTIVLLIMSALLAHFLKTPAGFILMPLFLGGFLVGIGWLELQLPNWLLQISYALIGWRVGLAFDIQTLRKAYKILPHIFGATVTLMLFCALLAWVLVLIYDIDPLTAYLATSPGGLDTIAAIAFSHPYSDMSFVITLQVARLLLINLLTPLMIKLKMKHYM